MFGALILFYNLHEWKRREEACEERCDEQGKAPEADGKGYKKVNLQQPRQAAAAGW